MSADTHKVIWTFICQLKLLQYGFTTKGTSVVLFKDEELRRYMYFVQPNWPGGLCYGSLH